MASARRSQRPHAWLDDPVAPARRHRSSDRIPGSTVIRWRKPPGCNGADRNIPHRPRGSEPDAEAGFRESGPRHDTQPSAERSCAAIIAIVARRQSPARPLRRGRRARPPTCRGERPASDRRHGRRGLAATVANAILASEQIWNDFMPRRPRRDFDALTEAQLLAGRTTARRIELDRVPRRSAAGRDSRVSQICSTRSPPSQRRRRATGAFCTSRHPPSGTDRSLKRSR